MTRRMFFWMLVPMLAALFAAGPATADERSELKERFKERYATLTALKRDGKIGETYRGLADLVRERYADDPAREGQTIAQFLREENRDRERLYELIAKETGTTPEQVAKRDALRRFESARPNDYLMPEEGKWVRKKDL